VAICVAILLVYFNALIVSIGLIDSTFYAFMSCLNMAFT